MASVGDFLAGSGDFLAGGGDDVRSNSGSEDDSIRLIGSKTFAFFFGGPVPDFWPLEELALTMVSDLLVLWRLARGLVGVFLTSGGTR